mgnify:CR=1 FL=1
MNTRKIGIGLLLVAVAALVALYVSFMPATLEVTEDIPIQLIEPPKVEGVSLSTIYAGRMRSAAAFAYRGGKFSDERVFGMGSILVRHPAADMLFDTGFGTQVDDQVAQLPWIMRQVTDYTAERPVSEQLAAADYDYKQISRIVLTHAHWDHVSGIPDFPGLQIMVSHEEAEFMESDDPAAALVKSFGFLPVAPFNYRDVPYLGFERSFDVFGDGSMVVVPVPGHTPGAIVTFVHTEDGKHYALIGDLVWQKEGIELPAERPWLARMLVDHDAAAVRRQIVHLHRLQKMWPELIIVPAHDRRVWDQLPRFAG